MNNCIKSKIMKNFLFLLSFLCCFTSGISFAKKSGNLTIFSESSMSYGLLEVARQYSKEKNIIVSVNFNSAFDLIQGIEFGDSADIFITSHKYWIDTIKQKGVVDIYNISNIAKDRLALIISNDNSHIDADFFRKYTDMGQIIRYLGRKKISIVIGSEKDSLGLYTRNIVNNARISRRYIHHKPQDSKDSIVDFVGKNKNYCAIVFISEIKEDDNVNILAEISNIDIYYQALVVAGDNMDMARNFLKDLKNSKYQEVLKKHNLIIN